MKASNPFSNYAMEANAQNNNQQCVQNKNTGQNRGKNTVKKL